MLTAVLALVPDPDWAVREQLAASLGELPAEHERDRAGRVPRALRERPGAMDAALSGLNGSEAGRPGDALDARHRETPQRAMAITMLAATIVSNAQDAPIQRAVRRRRGDAASGLAAIRAACRGAEVTLLGVDAVPGGARPRARTRRRGAPCPTCPGGRAGPGGASAFPRARGAADPSLQEGNARRAPARGGRRGGRGRGAGGPR